MESLLNSFLILAGLLLPGLGWARAFRTPWPWFASGIYSALLIFSGVLLLNAVSIPITRSTLGGGLDPGRSPRMGMAPSINRPT